MRSRTYLSGVHVDGVDIGTCLTSVSHFAKRAFRYDFS